tara:strand:- start:127 stop:435 length:309 start_codon:yes stop_codon:yes gene_type:complete
MNRLSSKILKKWLSPETLQNGIPIILDEPGYFLACSIFQILEKLGENFKRVMETFVSLILNLAVNNGPWNILYPLFIFAHNLDLFPDLKLKGNGNDEPSTNV